MKIIKIILFAKKDAIIYWFNAKCYLRTINLPAGLSDFILGLQAVSKERTGFLSRGQEGGRAGKKLWLNIS